MAPFRPANLNKRAYPGNANVIGPTARATLGLTTTTCFSSTNVCGACQGPTLCLGCRCDFCRCPCCDVCCSCDCTVCSRTVPSGMWSSSEQYEARTRDAWGNSTSSSNAATCLCCINVGFACTNFQTDYRGFFICCGPSTNKWFVSPSCTQINTSWNGRGSAITCANSLMGACGWFVPSCTQMYNPGFLCRTYWDSYGGSFFYWTNTELNASQAIAMFTSSGELRVPYDGTKNPSYAVRTFRCTAT